MLAVEALSPDALHELRIRLEPGGARARVVMCRHKGFFGELVCGPKAFPAEREMTTRGEALHCIDGG